MIDTHAHLFLDEFNSDRNQVIENAKRAGVKAIILPNVDNTTIDSMHELSENQKNFCFPCIGVHPTSINENYIHDIKRIEQALEFRTYIGIGEIGVDLYWDKTHLQEQLIAFDIQIRLALKHKLPIIVHTRQSFDEALAVVSKYKDKGLRGVFHCFSGNAEQAKQLVDLGFKLGIGGVITFKNSGLADNIRKMSLNDLVIETDAPYLAPSPLRGQRNEPSYLTHIVEKLAETFQVSKDVIIAKTTQNAIELFNLKISSITSI